MAQEHREQVATSNLYSFSLCFYFSRCGTYCPSNIPAVPIRSTSATARLPRPAWLPWLSNIPRVQWSGTATNSSARLWNRITNSCYNGTCVDKVLMEISKPYNHFLSTGFVNSLAVYMQFTSSYLVTHDRP